MEREPTRGPHLVQADIGRDDRVPVEQPVEGVERGLSGMRGRRSDRVIAERAPDARPPRRAIRRRSERGGQPAQGHTRVGADDDLGRDELAELGRVGIDVNHASVRREPIEIAGQPVVESGADRNDAVRLVQRPVCDPGAVHAWHPEPSRSPTAFQAVEGRDVWRAGRGRERAQLGVGARRDDAGPREHERARRAPDQLRSGRERS